MGPIAWLTILHTYFIGVFNNFSAEPKIKGQMYKQRGRREGWMERGSEVVAREGCGVVCVCVCVRGVTPGKGKQGD